MLINRADWYGMLIDGFIYTECCTNTYDSYSCTVIILLIIITLHNYIT